MELDTTLGGLCLKIGGSVSETKRGHDSLERVDGRCKGEVPKG